MNIPNYIDIPVIDTQTGMFTAEWKAIFQQLISTLQTNAGSSGVVVPTLNATEITTVQNNVTTDGLNTKTCQFGTFVYDSTNKVVKVALDNAGSPQFYTVVTI